MLDSMFGCLIIEPWAYPKISKTQTLERHVSFLKSIGTLGNQDANDASLTTNRSNQSISLYFYSIHELSVYDFPAFVDFVLNRTEHSKVDIVGISLGSTISLMGLSEKPEYNEKIRNNVMFAPAGRYAHTLGAYVFTDTVSHLMFPVLIVSVNFFDFLF